MAYSIELAKDAKYIGVFLTGEVTNNDLENSREEANRALIANKWNRILIDGTQGQPRISVVEDFEFVSEFTFRFPAGVRLALVVRHQEQGYFQFIEDVAQNRGANLKLFTDKGLALNWLLAC